MEKKQDLILIDVRTREEVDKGQIPGSINIPREFVFKLIYCIHISSFEVTTSHHFPVCVCIDDFSLVFQVVVFVALLHLCECFLFVNLSVDTVEAALTMTPEDFKAKYGINKPPLDAPELVFHCQMGRRGVTATSKAHELGYVK